MNPLVFSLFILNWLFYSTCQKLVGIAFVLVGEFFHGCQFVYEEKYVVAYDLHPLKVVGYEGRYIQQDQKDL